MPLLLLLPVLLLVVAALWAVLLPFSLWARYASGRARRRAQAWAVRVNAWLLLFSVLVFLLSASVAGFWLAHALREAVLGTLLGALLGLASLRLTRFEHDSDGFFYTPNRWLVLGLTLLVALRLLAGLWLTWLQFADSAALPASTWLRGGGLLGVAGVLLGYHCSFTWGLRGMLPKARLRAR